jgi:hypothetical protein
VFLVKNLLLQISITTMKTLIQMEAVGVIRAVVRAVVGVVVGVVGAAVVRIRVQVNRFEMRTMFRWKMSSPNR